MSSKHRLSQTRICQNQTLQDDALILGPLSIGAQALFAIPEPTEHLSLLLNQLIHADCISNVVDDLEFLFNQIDFINHIYKLRI